MDFAHFCRRLFVGDQAVTRGLAARRRGVVWLFIMLVALFLTQPASYPDPDPHQLALGTARPHFAGAQAPVGECCRQARTARLSTPQAAR